MLFLCVLSPYFSGFLINPSYGKARLRAVLAELFHNPKNKRLTKQAQLLNQESQVLLAQPKLKFSQNNPNPNPIPDLNINISPTPDPTNPTKQRENHLNK